MIEPEDIAREVVAVLEDHIHTCANDLPHDSPEQCLCACGARITTLTIERWSDDYVWKDELKLVLDENAKQACKE